MANPNGNAWWKGGLLTILWAILIGIFMWATWQTRQSDALCRQVEINTGRLDSIEASLPAVKEDLAAIRTDLQWIKRNIK